MRLIDADALLAEYCRGCYAMADGVCQQDICGAVVIVKEAPTIDPEELRPKGRCKFCKDLDRMYEVVCYIPHDNGNATDIPVNYCPNCGARMEGR